MAIGTTNVDINDIRVEIGESTYDLPELCASNNRNKWGIHRINFNTLLTAQERYDLMIVDPDLKYWRGYDHTRDAPGILSSMPDILDAGSIEFNIRTYGVWTLSRSGFSPSEEGWYKVTLVSSNHSVSSDPTTSQVIGSDEEYDYESEWLANMTLTLQDNTTSENRSGTLTITHPDQDDPDAGVRIYSFTQGFTDNGGIIVSPQSFTFGPDPSSQSLSITLSVSKSGASITKVDEGHGTDWFHVSSSYITSSATITVSVDEHNSPQERWGTIEVLADGNVTPISISLTQTGY